MQFVMDTAQIFVPDGTPEEEALRRTTHMGIGAHQDDLEIMAADGILRCYQQKDQWFTGVVVTDGRGSSRTGIYADYTDEEMRAVRAQEQKKAAFVGEYAAQLLLDFTSSHVKDASNQDPVEQLRQVLEIAQPEIIYTHNLTDKHPTHVGVVVKTIMAIRALPKEKRPKKIYGCEVWRDLDWMVDSDKVMFDLSRQEGLQTALVGLFDSQISGGKRYDLATMGRRRAHATYYESHGTDETTGMNFGMDLTPLIEDDSLDILAFAENYMQRFVDDVRQRISSVL